MSNTLYREFWIDPSTVDAWIGKAQSKENYSFIGGIHVIEKSAYDAVVKELRRSGECGHGQLQHEMMQLEEKNKMLEIENFELKARVEALEEVKKFFEMTK